MGHATPEPLPEQRLNELLRQVDWRFLLRQRTVPQTLDLTSGRISQAIRLVSEETPRTQDSVDLVVLGRPTRAGFRTALEALRPGGEVVCRWRVPIPGGAGRARRRLKQAGFTDVRLYWPGPIPYRTPQFWLPLGSSEALGHLLSQRTAKTRAQTALRWLWRASARAGLLAPLWAIAQTPGRAEPRGAPDEINTTLPQSRSILLLTGGKRSVNKVVGLPFAEQRSEPSVVAKHARVPEAERGLRREAEVLRLLEKESHGIGGVPRLRAQGYRVGRMALVESAVFGQPLLSALSPETFPDLALRVTRWLIELAGAGETPSAEWRPRLVAEPLRDFERNFGSVVAPGTAERARRLLEDLGDLAQVCEHRDCSPWNVVLTETGKPALLDWESAEPRGLPALDLVYFLANSAFVLDRALESGRTRESYERLLDPETPHGHVAAACLEEYSARLGLDRAVLPRLRLLCWIVHCRSEHGRLEMDLASGDPRHSVFPRLVEVELRHNQDAP